MDIGVVYNAVAGTTLLLSFLCLIFTFGSMFRVTESRNWQLLKIAREKPLHFAFSIISFMIFVSTIGTYLFPFSMETDFVVRTIFFGSHLLVGSFITLWVSLKIDDIYSRLFQKDMEKYVLENKLDVYRNSENPPNI